MSHHGYITHGTVLHGTLLPYDLIESFVSELEDLSVGENDPSIKELIEQGNNICAAGSRYGHDKINYPQDDRDGEFYAETINDLIDKINELLPEGSYFGTHPGDGADFGYWPTDLED